MNHSQRRLSVLTALARALLAAFIGQAAPRRLRTAPCPRCSCHLGTFLMPMPRLATCSGGVGSDCHEAS